MGADATYLFYGVRYQVSDPLRVSQLQTDDHPLVRAGKKAGLDTYWGNFGSNGNELLILNVGRQIATLGHEGSIDIELSDTEPTKLQIDTRRKLNTGGFSLVPALFAQFEADV
jgi:hypothetical protein